MDTNGPLGRAEVRHSICRLDGRCIEWIPGHGKCARGGDASRSTGGLGLEFSIEKGEGSGANEWSRIKSGRWPKRRGRGGCRRERMRAQMDE